MKTKKANAILATFIFATSFLMLCSFGTDAAYVILSRYKLQKITEAIALEYASSFGANDRGQVLPEGDRNQLCDETRRKYQRLYNAMGTGVLIFDIESMEFRTNRDENGNPETRVRVRTRARVLPAFLRFIGVTRIIVHSTVSAKSESIVLNEARMERAAGPIFGLGRNIDIIGGVFRLANEPNHAFVEFRGLPFESADRTKTAEIISAKNTGTGDFMVNIDYTNLTGNGGGFFIFGSYQGFNRNGGGERRWVDLSNKAINNERPIEPVCQGIGENRQCFGCISTPDNVPVVFDLSRNIDDSGGKAERLTDIRIYRTGGLTERRLGGAETGPCNLVPNARPAVSFNRDADVTLTILNNVSLIQNREYNDINADDDNRGFCAAE